MIWLILLWRKGTNCRFLNVTILITMEFRTIQFISHYMSVLYMLYIYELTSS